MLLSVALEQDVVQGAKVIGLRKFPDALVAVVDYQGSIWHYFEQNHTLNTGEIAIEIMPNGAGLPNYYDVDFIIEDDSDV